MCPRTTYTRYLAGSGRGGTAASGGGGGGRGGGGAGAGGGDSLADVADVADGSECRLPDGSDLHAAVQDWKGAAGGVSEGGTVGVGGGAAVAWQLELPDGADKLEWRGGGDGASGKRQSVIPPLPPELDLPPPALPRCRFFLFSRRVVPDCLFKSADTLLNRH
jgi:hypothetical protein